MQIVRVKFKKPCYKAAFAKKLGLRSLRLFIHYLRLCLPKGATAPRASADSGAKEHLKFPRNQPSPAFQMPPEPLA